MTSKLTITDERLAELVAFKPLPGTDITSATRDEWMAMAAELQERRKAAEPELKPANLANKFYERYPLATFKSDSERAEAFGYFMAGAELQCFGEFIRYEDLCGDE